MESGAQSLRVNILGSWIPLAWPLAWAAGTFPCLGDWTWSLLTQRPAHGLDAEASQHPQFLPPGGPPRAVPSAGVPCTASSRFAQGHLSRLCPPEALLPSFSCSLHCPVTSSPPGLPPRLPLWSLKSFASFADTSCVLPWGG